MSDCVSFGADNGNKQDLTPGMIATSVILLAIVIIVLLGNSLVITAVIRTRKLRTVTNIYIVSLACSDLLLGICVLPYSASYEVLDYWPFGETWCSMWLAIDVLLCTASILNLCAISLDRFLAVTSPIKYPSLMSKRRGRILVSCVWILSLMISLPPLLGWNDENMIMNVDVNNSDRNSNIVNSSLVNVLNQTNISEISFASNGSCIHEVKQCSLTSTKWYRIYASMGSFYIPCLVMIFFYCRIYLTAIRTASSIRSGILTTKKIHEFRNNKYIDTDVVTMRIHRGGSNIARSRSPSCVSGRRTSHIAYPDLLINSETNFEMDKLHSKSFKLSSDESNIIFERYSSDGFTKHEDKEEDTVKNDCSSCIKMNRSTKKNSMSSPPNDSPYMKRKQRKTSDTAQRRPMIVICNGRTSQKKHIRKFIRETKAAKTVAIIIGAFILCWLPFFIIYLIGAFCLDCIPPLVFSVLFWLGYCNSMLNPFIYGLFSRDFRFAFRRLLFCNVNKTMNICSKTKEPNYKRRHQLEIQILESESISDF